MEHVITDSYALYHGDCCEILRTIPDASVHLSVYSPPFCGLYHYSSSERDLSNCRTREEFFEHYAFVVKEVERVTLPGRLTAVHCSDIPNGSESIYDLPGDIIRLHERLGFAYVARHMVWKEPLSVRMRTMAKGLAHKQIVEDSSLCDVAGADDLLLFRKRGENAVPVTHASGFMSYAGAREIPHELKPFRGHPGHHTENRYSHWIWRQYASAFWDDVRIDRVLPFRDSREPDDEKHVHPLQLDIIERIIELRSNPGEVVLTPFMGVGSEVYGAVRNGRKAIGIELKASYFKQATLNVGAALKELAAEQAPLFASGELQEVAAMDPRESKITANPNSWKSKKQKQGA
jgi:DNA modification methylase